MGTRRYMVASLVIIFGSAVTAAFAQEAFPREYIPYAEMIVFNGKILTVNENFAIAEAVAVRDGRIQAVGDSKTVLRLAGPQTRKIDLAGKTIVPGFIDTHLHSATIGNGFSLGVKHKGSVAFKTIPSGLEELKALVDKVPAGEIILVNGPFNGNDAINVVTRQQLDTVSPNNPVFIIYAGELSVVNTKAWEMSKVPAGIAGALKDAQGQPTGQLRTGAHGYMTYEVLPWPVIDEPLLARQANNMKALNAQGLTTVIGRQSGLAMTIFRELALTDRLTMRMRVSHEMTRSNGQVERFLKRTGNLVGFNINNMLTIYSATVQHPDGTSGSGAALTFKPKLRQLEGDPYGMNGADRWSDDGLKPEESDRTNILLAVKYGWPISGVHSVGDKGTNLLLHALDEAESAQKLVPVRGHHGLDHQVMQVPENIELMKKMGVIPSLYFLNPGGREPGELVYQYGGDAVHRMSPTKTLVDAGLKPVIEADNNRWPTSAPMWNLQGFITRADEKGAVWGKHEAVDRVTALRMYTSWAAAYSNDQDRLGSLEEGKLADFVLLDRDYMTVPANELAKVKILMTVVDGKIVFDRERDGTPAFEQQPADTSR